MCGVIYLNNNELEISFFPPSPESVVGLYPLPLHGDATSQARVHMSDSTSKPWTNFDPRIAKNAEEVGTVRLNDLANNTIFVLCTHIVWRNPS